MQGPTNTGADEGSTPVQRPEENGQINPINMLPAPQADSKPAMPATAPAAGEAVVTPGTAPAAAPPPKARSIKTPEQKEALEAAYLMKKFPEEDVRRALGGRIGLTEQQVQVWFSHKRRKEKKDQEEAAIRQSLAEQQAAQPTLPSADVVPQLAGTQPPGPVPMDVSPAAGNAGPSQQAAATQPAGETLGLSNLPHPAAASAAPAPGVQPAQQASATRTTHPAAASAAALPSASAPLQGGAQVAALRVAAVPPAAPAPPAIQPSESAVSEAVRRTVNLIAMEGPSRELTAEEKADIPELIALARAMMPVPFRLDGPQLTFEFDDPPRLLPDGTYADEELAIKRKRVDGDEDENARKRRSSAGAKGNARHEAERLERERKRAEEKAERDRKKQEIARTKEEVRLRVIQEREERKLQLQAEKDRRAQERKEKLSERRKEKEVLKALQAQEKQATRLRQRDAGTGPKDDLDLEWETLLAAQQEAGYGSGTEGEGPKDHPLPVRPEFPPSHLSFQPVFPPELEDQLGGDLLFIWSFLHSFGDLLGVWSVTVDQLLQALLDGEKSRLLGEMHIGMLRIVQADMEEAHATGAMQSGSAINFLDRAIVNCATMLEEAWAWGFDVDVWRAHVNALTWPEVLRQMAIAWGLGPKRPKPKKLVKPKMGTDGEDLVADESGSLKLRLPARFGVGTVKAAAWQVLAETGPEGLTISEIARRIQQSGLRDLRTSKTPEASVAGALSRDVIFARIAPATYALQAVVTYSNKLTGGDTSLSSGKKESTPTKSEAAGGKTAVKDEAAERPDTGKEGAIKEEEQPATGEKKAENGEEDEEHEGDSSGDEEDEEEHEEKHTGEPWIQSLQSKEYSELGLLERVTILVALIHLTIDGPTLRNTLEARLEEAGRVRKQMWEEGRMEKKRRQAEAAAKAKLAADEAQRVMDLFHSKEGSVAPSEMGEAGPGPEQQQNGNAMHAEGNHRPASSAAPNADTPAAPNVDISAPPSTRGTPDPEQKPAEPTPSREQSSQPAGKPPTAAPTLLAKASAAGTPTGALDCAGSGMPLSEAGHSRKSDGDDDISIAVAAKQRQLHRAETIRKAEEANAIRSEPLGLDRRHNRYWRFVDEENHTGDPFAGRLVMESHVDSSFKMLGSAEGIEGLIAALDKRGAREGPLYNALLRYRVALSQAMPTTTMAMPEPRDEESKEQLLNDQQAWTQSVMSVASRKAKGKRPNLQDDNPLLAKLKLDMLLMEQALPKEGLQADWDASAWKESVHSSTDAAKLRACLATLESGINEHWLSLHFRTTPLLVRGAWLPTGNEVASALPGSNGEVQQLQQHKADNGEAPVSDPAPLEWLPCTLPSLALRLQALDAALIYAEGSLPAREVLLAYRYTQRPAALPKELAAEAKEGKAAPKCAVLCGQPVGVGGRSRPSLIPPFPLALIAGERRAFSMDWDKLRKEIADEKAGIIPPPMVPKRPPSLSVAEKGSRSRGKVNGRAPARGGKTRGGKSKAKSRQSALREEFDRQSEEEEAAERRGFSTPGLSDDESDLDLPPTGRRGNEEEMDISD